MAFNMDAIRGWVLPKDQSKMSNGYKVIKVAPDTRVRFSHVRFLTQPTVGQTSTVFRWVLSSDTKAFFTYIQGDFTQHHIAPFYAEHVGKELTLDVVEDNMSYIRSSKDGRYVHLRFMDVYESLASLDTSCSYTIDIELRAVSLKANKIHMDWRLVQVDMDEPMFLSNTVDADVSDDDAAGPSIEESHMAHALLLAQLDSKINIVGQRLHELNEELENYRMLKNSLESDNAVKNICRVQEKIDEMESA